MKKVWLYAAVGAVVLTWGNAFVAIKYLLDIQHLTAMGLTALRYVPAAAISLALLFSFYDRRNVLSCWRNEWKGIALYGITGVLGYNLALNYGETRIAAGTASLIVGLSPVLTLVASSLALKERITARKLGGIVLAFAGLFVVVKWGSREALDFRYLLGVLITLGAPVSWALYTIIGKPVVTRADPNIVTLSAIVWGSVPLLPFLPFGTLGTISAAGWAALGFLTAVCTVFGFLVWSWALRRTEAARLGAVVYLIPLVTVLSELLLLRQAPSAGLLAGGAVLIAGVALAEV
ncbi:MAG TPA: DMT family transporter [Candidatus Edwardsbacteria bacterium]|nr:DMT family transporter [Candidatus Edwardsbacteria bacterium]